MKLNLGNNIKKYRKEKDMTQEELADYLGVSSQAVSRWENGTTYPDIELIPVLANLFDISTDVLFDMKQTEKEIAATAVLTELAELTREQPLNVTRINELMREVRQNYIDCDCFWHFWLSANTNAYRNENILPEARKVFEAVMQSKAPIWNKNQTILQFLLIEDEEHIDEFIKEYSTESDMSKRVLFHHRYRMRGDTEKDNIYRQKVLFYYLSEMIGSSDLWGEFYKESEALTDFYLTILHGLCQCAPDEKHPISGNGKVDLWVYERLYIAVRKAGHLIKRGQNEQAFVVLEDMVSLLEETMKIIKTTLTPSSTWLSDIVWTAQEQYTFIGSSILLSDEDERAIWIYDEDGYCYWIIPNNFLSLLQKSDFDSIRKEDKFKSLIERIKKLIKKRNRQQLK